MGKLGRMRLIRPTGTSKKKFSMQASNIRLQNTNVRHFLLEPYSSCMTTQCQFTSMIFPAFQCLQSVTCHICKRNLVTKQCQGFKKNSKILQFGRMFQLNEKLHAVCSPVVLANYKNSFANLHYTYATIIDYFVVSWPYLSSDFQLQPIFIYKQTGI